MVFDGNLETVHVEDRLNTNELFRKHYDLSEKEQKATERAQRKLKKPLEKHSKKICKSTSTTNEIKISKKVTIDD